VILSSYDDPVLIALSIEAGAAAFVLKDNLPHELVGAVRRAAHAARA
jgi:DNA-binding NarL/FixJ family response regulator